MKAKIPVVLRGYDRRQVDELLDRLEATLHHGQWSLTAEEVRTTRFDIVLRGYEMEAVDELLERAMEDLGDRPPPGPTRPPMPNDELIAWIGQAGFRASRMRLGYRREDVDAFIERVLAGLRGTGPAVTGLDVRDARFGAVRLSGGYDEEDVDDFMTALTRALEGR